MNGATKTEASAIDKGRAKGVQDVEEGAAKCQGEIGWAEWSPWMPKVQCVAF